MKKYKHNISNLDCANCAREIEEALNKNKEFKNATVNFNTKKITYESEKEFTVKELNEIIRKIEPEATISEEEINEKKTIPFINTSNRSFNRSTRLHLRNAKLYKNNNVYDIILSITL